ncbi:hypothetical protein Tco_0456444 [Tanacetum coccineum]
MNQEQAQQAARDEKLIPTNDRQFWFTITKVKKSSFYQFDLDNKKCQIDVELFWKILCIFPRVLDQEFTVPPSHDSLIDFLIELGYKGHMKQLSDMFVDHMHQPWRTLGTIINK